MGTTPSSVPPAYDERAVADASRVSRPWSMDDIVVVLFALFGFTGGALLPLFLPIPPITTSFLLATGLAALTYRFLGGIQVSSVTFGVLKLSGTLAALVGIAMLINHAMIVEVRRAYQVTGHVFDDKGKPLRLDESHYSVWPHNIYSNPQGNDFEVTFTTGTDFSGNPSFPTLTISDGPLSDSIDLTPGAKNDVAVEFAGTMIKIGEIHLHQQSSSNSAESLTPTLHAGETASQSTTPEMQP